MKKLKNLFAFDIILVIFIIFINIYFKNLYIFAITIIYLLLAKEYKLILCLFILIFIITFRLSINDFKINYAFIKSVNEHNYIATNILYDIKIKSDNIYEIGDFIYLDNINENKEIKYNTYYYSDQNHKIFHFINLRNVINNNTKEYNFYNQFIQKTLFKNNLNEFDLDIFISWYLVYLSINKLFKRYLNEYFSTYLSLFVLLNIIGLEYQFIRILIIVLSKLYLKDRVIALNAACLIMMILYPNMIIELAFIIPFLIRYILIFKHILDFKVIMMLIQSFFFYITKPFILLFFNFYQKIIIIMLMVSIINLLIPLDYLEIYFKNIFEFIYNILNFGIKGKISIIVLIIYYLIINKYKFNKYYQIALLSVLLLSNVSNIFGSIIFVDVNQGDATIIKAPFNNEIILIDTGSLFNYKKLEKALNKEGIYVIDKIIISHFDSDHYGSLHKIYKDFKVKEIIYEHRDIVGKYFNFISLNNNLHNNDNDNSIVLGLNYQDLNFLFTGDISKNVEREIINKNHLKIDVLHLAHHGSNTSTSEEIIEYLNPKLAIISADKKIYRHPHIDTINTLKKYQITHLNTDDVGDIKIIFLKYFHILLY